MTTEKTLLEVYQICATKKGVPILHDVSLAIRDAEIVTLIGPNGAGKTSLVRILLGLDEPTSGSIERHGDLRIGYVPQKVNVPNELPLRVCDFLFLSGDINENQMMAMLHEMGIADLADSALQNISGGELQRVILTRALLKQPQLLVLDEPAQGLDVVGQQALYKIISEIRDRHHCAVLLVSHDLHLVMSATDQVICLNTHVCCTGHPDDVSEHPEYLKLFGSALDGLAVYSHHHDHEHDIHGNIVQPSDHSGCSHE